jgi:two-component system cell cycle sensor histidine kinase/response regulator CckA
MADTELRSLSPDPVVDRPERRGSVLLVLLLAVAIVLAAVVVSYTARTQTTYVLAFLGILAVVGIVALFGGTIGLIEVAGRSRRFDLAKAIVDGLPDGALVTDSTGRIIYANAAYAALTGAENAADLRPLDQVFAGNPALSEAVYRLNLASREARRHHEEVRVAQRPGTEASEPQRLNQWLSLRVQPLVRDRRGTSTLWTATDISRDRERHETVFQELQHAIDFLDHAPAGFFSLEPDGRVGYVNATLAGWLGMDLADAAISGVKLSDIIPLAHIPRLKAQAATPGEFSTDVLDLDLIDKAGRSRPVRLLHRVSFSTDGTSGASRTLVIDRANEAEVLDSSRAELRFARFFDNAPLAIATVDAAGAISRSNAAFSALLPRHASPGLLISDAVSDRDRSALSTALAAARDGQANIAPFDVVFPGEEPRSARVFVASFGAGEAAALYLLDMTEQRRLEQQVAQGVKMNAVGQLAGGIAHDFNNVLTAIIGFCDLLLSNHKPSDPSFQDIMNIKSNANRAAGLVKQLLAFSRRQTLRPQVLTLPSTLSDLTVLLSRLLGENVKLEMRHGRDLWPVRADLSQFEQVVVNLAVNAKDAMPKGGRLTISTRNISEADVPGLKLNGMTPADYVAVDVTDTGTGMPPEIIEKIFEPFFTTKEMGKGTGLGLSSVYGIVKQTGGFVYVDSVLDQGTTFHIFLPRHVPDANELAQDTTTTPAAPLHGEQPPSPRSETMSPVPKPVDLTGQGTILLVEDEDAVRAFAVRALQGRGYTVLDAASPGAAIDLMRDNLEQISLIVTDVQMPEMDGPTMVIELKKMKPDVPVVFMSGYAEETFRRSIADGENSAFLPKPFTLKQLAQAVKDAMPV